MSGPYKGLSKSIWSLCTKTCSLEAEIKNRKLAETDHKAKILSQWNISNFRKDISVPKLLELIFETEKKML